MQKKEYPILEYDESRDAYIRPENVFKRIDGISEHAVLCFFGKSVEKLVNELPHEIIGRMSWESAKQPIYQVEYKSKKIVLIQAHVGAPLAAGYVEDLTAYGCKKFMVCGGCGVLQKDIAVGHLIIPVTAVRDEGTSYHYVPPSREISMDDIITDVIEKTLIKNKVPYIKGKTWTTDAPFRETRAKTELRRQEGCVTVEMEVSAFMAVAQYLDVKYGQILYAGDSLAGDEWDERGWHGRDDIRDFLLRLTMDCCLGM